MTWRHVRRHGYVNGLEYARIVLKLGFPVPRLFKMRRRLAKRRLRRYLRSRLTPPGDRTRMYQMLSTQGMIEEFDRHDARRGARADPTERRAAGPTTRGWPSASGWLRQTGAMPSARNSRKRRRTGADREDGRSASNPRAGGQVRRARRLAGTAHTVRQIAEPLGCSRATRDGVPV
jgi:hypothetical protein